MIRVLQVMGTTRLGGAESRTMDIYRHMNRDEIQFDFLITEGNGGIFSPQIEELGGHVYTMPKYRIYNHFQYRKAIKQFFIEHSGYAAVHGHMTSTASIYLPIAKKSGVPLTIAHARSAGVDSGIKGKLTNMLRKSLPDRCDMMFACSDLAASAVYGEDNYKNGDVKVMPNAIEIGAFAPVDSVREEIRKQYNIEDKYVIGHVGRFHEAKNHPFIIKVFAKFVEKREDAVLMLLGDGPLKPQIETLVNEIDEENLKAGKPGIKDKVIFAGNQSPSAPYYMAFDYFLFPSLYEGMPGTVVEAQAAGLGCMVSDTVTRMSKVTELVEFESLSRDEERWAERLYTFCGDSPVCEMYIKRKTDNQVVQQIMLDSDYNVERQVEFYTKLYTRGQ